MIESVKQAEKIMVSLGNASKMPCHTYSTPARLCVTGRKLRKIKGSTCHKCYAMKGNYIPFHTAADLKPQHTEEFYFEEQRDWLLA